MQVGQLDGGAAVNDDRIKIHVVRALVVRLGLGAAPETVPMDCFPQGRCVCLPQIQRLKAARAIQKVVVKKALEKISPLQRV